MTLNDEQRRIVQSTARWALAVLVVSVAHIFAAIKLAIAGRTNGFIVELSNLLVSSWQALGLGLLGLAFASGEVTKERLSSGLHGLRTFAKAGALALPVLTIATAFSCDFDEVKTTVESGDVERIIWDW